jgi:hypothetical protein
MSEEDKVIEAVAVALTIQAHEDSYGVGLMVRNEFDFIEDDLKVEFVTHWILMLHELRKNLIAKKGDQTVIH